MVQKGYNYDFFANETLKTTTSGEEVPDDVAQNMLSSADEGNECMKTFVAKRLVKKDMSVFDKIKKSKLNSGIKKPSNTPNPVEAMKEYVQRFRILVEKNVTLNEGFKRPVTKFPMSIAESNTDLRGAKSKKNQG